MGAKVRTATGVLIWTSASRLPEKYGRTSLPSAATSETSVASPDFSRTARRAASARPATLEARRIVPKASLEATWAAALANVSSVKPDSDGCSTA